VLTNLGFLASRGFRSALALASVVAATVAALPGGSASGDPAVTISLDQGLSPAFSPAIHDYVVRCTGNPVVVSVDAPAGTSVSVDHAASRGGSFSQAVPLSSGQEFSIALQASASTDQYYVRCLPADFPGTTFTPQGAVNPGLFTIDGLGRYTAIFDTDGLPVWWRQTASGALDSQVLGDGTYGFYDVGSAADQLYSLTGTPVRPVAAATGATDLHDLQLLSNGDYLLTATQPRDGIDLSAHGGPADATVIDCLVEELTPSGQQVWSWSAADHLTPDDTPQYWYGRVLPNGSPYDIFHLNSVEVHGGEVVISMRHTDAVWGIDRSTGNVLWKLGGTSRAESLTVEGDPQGTYPLRGNHDARVLSDGTLTLHDNNTGLSSPPRAVRYSLDEAGQTATLLESISDADAGSSACCGSARKLGDGNWLTSWGGDPIVGEYDPSGARLFKLDIGAGFSYRAIPVPPSVTAAAVRAGIDDQYPRVDSDTPPVASFSSSPATVRGDAPLSVDAAASYDPDGSIVSYNWDFGDGSSGAGTASEHRYVRAGSYLVRLTVGDNWGAANTISRVVTVRSTHRTTPHAAFLALSPGGHTGNTVEFDGSSSYPGSGPLVSYRWSFGDGSSASGMIVSHGYARTGRYRVQLKVTDTAGLSSSVHRIVRITAPRHVRIAVSPAQPHVSSAATFSASARDPGGIASYRWRFGDGSSGHGGRVSHVYARRGRYTVTLTVADNNGAVATRRLVLLVR